MAVRVVAVMAVEDPIDLLLYLDVDEFATSAVYTPTAGSPTTIVGIFDNPSASLTATDMMEITIPQPRFLCRTTDAPNAAEGHTIVINSVTYTIRVVTTDGLGITSLFMEKN